MNGIPDSGRKMNKCRRIHMERESREEGTRHCGQHSKTGAWICIIADVRISGFNEKFNNNFSFQKENLLLSVAFLQSYI